MTMSAMKLKGLPGPQLYCECLQCHQQDGRASEIYLYIYTLYIYTYIYIYVYIYICTIFFFLRQLESIRHSPMYGIYKYNIYIIYGYFRNYQESKVPRSILAFVGHVADCWCFLNNAFGWQWWNHTENMESILKITGFVSMKIDCFAPTRTPAAPLSVSGGQDLASMSTFRHDPTLTKIPWKSVDASMVVRWIPMDGGVGCHAFGTRHGSLDPWPCNTCAASARSDSAILVVSSIESKQTQSKWYGVQQFVLWEVVCLCLLFPTHVHLQESTTRFVLTWMVTLHARTEFDSATEHDT